MYSGNLLSIRYKPQLIIFISLNSNVCILFKRIIFYIVFYSFSNLKNCVGVTQK